MKPIISDYNTYLARMDVSLPDKAFFLFRAPEARVIVDFGCAAGNLFRYIRSISAKEYIMIGYDNDQRMRGLASGTADVVCATLDELQKSIEEVIIAHGWSMKNVLFNFSSVLHEMSSEEIDRIFELIGSMYPGYVSIRDMRYKYKRALNYQNLAYFEKVKPEQVASFLIERGLSFLSLSDLAEYLLKYKYTENWERELDEHYFSGFTHAEPHYRSLIAHHKYRATWDVNYCLPHFDKQIKTDFNVDFNVSDYFTTHEQLLLERTDL